MKKPFIALFILMICSTAQAQIFVDPFVTADDVTIAHLEQLRTQTVNAINSADGGLIQAGTITTTQLDANANPENRWNEGFNDFVFTGLTIPTSVNLTSTTASGTLYMNGVRILKDATANTYTASKHTYVDLSDNGTYTYSEVAIGAAEPPVATDSLRLARVSTDGTTVLTVRDDRVTEISIAAGTAGAIADTDADTGIQTEESTDEDILRFDIGDATLTMAREVLTIQAIDANDVKFEPTTDNDVDLGSASKEFKDLYLDGTANIDGLAMPTTTVTDILDEDDMASDSPTDLSTQQSIKAYADLASFSAIEDYATSPSASTSKNQADLKICYGTLTIAGSSNSALSNLPFTSAGSYSLTVSFGTDTAATEAIVAVQSSGSAVTIYNNDNAQQAIHWIAIGT